MWNFAHVTDTDFFCAFWISSLSFYLHSSFFVFPLSFLLFRFHITLAFILSLSHCHILSIFLFLFPSALSFHLVQQLGTLLRVQNMHKATLLTASEYVDLSKPLHSICNTLLQTSYTQGANTSSNDCQYFFLCLI